jgi:hypothetical protein
MLPAISPKGLERFCKKKNRMKINIFQKILLAIYGIVFVYFSIIHVPFKTADRFEIDYDTLFSDRSNLDVSRLVLIILVISVLTAVLFLLIRNLKFTRKTRVPKEKISATKKEVPTTYKGGVRIGWILLTIAMLIFLIMIFKRLSKPIIVEVKPVVDTAIVDNNPKKEPVVNDPLGILSKPKDTAYRTRPKRSQSVLDSTDNFLLGNIPCTSERALKDFYSYMKFYYPDYKIYGKPVVKEHSTCTYRIQFTTSNPHFYEKEVMIVEITFNNYNTRYRFSTIRGMLY